MVTLIRSTALVLQYFNYMTKGWYSHRKIKERYNKLSTVAQDYYFLVQRQVF